MAAACTEYATQDAAGGSNPNVPFPMGTGGALGAITCPRAPVAQQTIFTDAITASLKLLQDTTNYTTTYFTNATEGVYIRITRTISDPLWSEAITRLNTKYAPCNVSYVLPGVADPTGYTCTNGCLYYWILRRASSSTSWEHVSPPATCP